MSQSTDINILESISRVSLFSDLSKKEMEELAEAVQVQVFGRKEIIFQEGDRYRGFYVVIQGQVLVYKLSASGKMLIMHICRPEDSFAEVPLFTGGSYPASAQTTRPARLLFFPQDAFEKFLDAHPSVCRKMLKVFARRLLDLNRQMEQLTLHEAMGRVARYLLSELNQQPRPNLLEPYIRLDVSKGALAAHLGTTIETLSRTFIDWRKKGLLGCAVVKSS